MIFESQRGGAGPEADRGQLLAKSIVQFLAEPFLLAVGNLEDLAFESLAPDNLASQLDVRCAQSFRSPLDEFFQQLFGSSQRGFRTFALGQIDNRGENKGSSFGAD